MAMLVFNWKRESMLGAGSYGAVYKAITTDATYPVIAVKSATSPESNNLMEEDQILRTLHGCSNIIRNLGYEITEESDDIAYFNMFLEYTPEGSLEDIISTRKSLKEDEIVKFARMILQGLRDVHEKGYVHCDLKPGNILVFPGNQLKLADFGLSKQVGVTDSEKLFKGTPIYMSPESVKLSWIHEPRLDIWSLGCIVVEMFTGKPMWSSCKGDIDALYLKICQGDVSLEVPHEISNLGLDFLKKCFQEDYCYRPNAEALLKHPFIDESYQPLMRPIPREEYYCNRATSLTVQKEIKEEKRKKEDDDDDDDARLCYEMQSLTVAYLNLDD